MEQEKFLLKIKSIWCESFSVRENNMYMVLTIIYTTNRCIQTQYILLVPSAFKILVTISAVSKRFFSPRNNTRGEQELS